MSRSLVVCCARLSLVVVAGYVSWGEKGSAAQPAAVPTESREAAVAAEPAVVTPVADPGARWLDLEADVARQVTVQCPPRRYLGHPTTMLLPDGRSMLCVHPEGHGRGPIVLQRSDDGGRSWGAPLPVPENRSTSKETPTIHLLVDPRSGRDRLILFSGLNPIRRSVSNDVRVVVPMIGTNNATGSECGAEVIAAGSHPGECAAGGRGGDGPVSVSADGGDGLDWIDAHECRRR